MQTITKWEREDLPIAILGGPGRPSYYDFAKCKEWFDKRSAVAQTATGDRLDANKARAEKDIWQARLAAQRHRQLAGELLHIEDVEKAWTAELSALRAAILNTYIEAAERVHRASTLQGVSGVEAELKAVAYELLRDLANPDRDVMDLPDRESSAEAAVSVVAEPVPDDDIVEESSS